MSDIKTPASTSRRAVLKGMVASTAALATGSAMAGSGHEHHHHHGGADNSGLIKLAYDCVKDGEDCLAHCIESFKTGDTTLAECADAVNEMIVMCNAVAKMAAYQSAHLKGVAKTCIEVCKVCEDQCRKHAAKHVSCRASAESCAAFIKECKKYV